MKKTAILFSLFPLFSILLTSCLASVYDSSLDDYIPVRVEQLDTAFTAANGDDMLIVTLYGGIFKSVLPAGDQFFLDGTALSVTPVRGDDTRLSFVFSKNTLRGGSHRFALRTYVLEDGASIRITVFSVRSGIWTSREDHALGRSAVRALTYGMNRFVAVAENGKMLYSNDGEAWTLIRAGYGSADSQFSEDTAINAIAFGNGIFYAVGSGARVGFSNDGIIWQGWEEFQFTGENINAVIYGGGRFVMAADGGKLMFQPNNEDWQLSGDTQFGTSGILGLAWGNIGTAANPDIKYVAVGYDGKISVSGNGAANWMVAASSFGTSHIRSAAFGNGVFVAAGDSGMIGYSGDGGSTWTPANTSLFRPHTINAVAFGNGLFLAVADNGLMARSDDGKDWEPISNAGLISGDSLKSVCFDGGGRFAAAAYNQSSTGTNANKLIMGYEKPGAGAIPEPPEDIVSSSFASAVGDSILTVKLTGGTFAANLRIQHFTLTGTPGFTISATAVLERTSDTEVIIRNSAPVTTAGSQTLTIGAGALTAKAGTVTVTASKNLIWQRSAANPLGSAGTSAVAFGGGKYIAVGRRGAMALSNDGVTWTEKYNNSNTIFHRDNPGDELAGIASASNTFVVVGSWGQIGYSTDAGATWTLLAKENGPFSAWENLPRLYDITYSGGAFVAVGQWGTIVSSANGQPGTWSVVNAGTDGGAFAGWGDAPELHGVAWGGGKFTAVGQWGTIVSSASGQPGTWSVVNTGTGGGAFTGWGEAPELYTVAWGAGRFIAAGGYGAAACSTDGTSWTADADTHFEGAGIFALAFGNGLYVAAGDNGRVITSTDGTVWTLMASGTGAAQSQFDYNDRINAVVYGNGKFVAGGSAYSDNNNGASRLTYSVY